MLKENLMITELNDIKIIGVAAAVSNNWTSLLDCSSEDESVIKKFTKKTGVTGRYNAGLQQPTADFCYAAAKKLLETKNIDKTEIGVLIFVTQTADYTLPATACLLQSRLGLDVDCIAFDVNLGCSGFTCGVNIAASLLQNSTKKLALVLAGDTSAKEKNPDYTSKTAHSATMLFGDSGTATLISKDVKNSNIKMISKTDGSGFKAIITPYGGWRNPVAPNGKTYGAIMDDVEVFNFACSDVPNLLKKTMEISESEPKDYDCLVLHQANLFIMKQVAKRAGFSMDNTLVSLDVFGNTSSSSVPISLVKEYGEKEGVRDIRALMCGFGVGLSWSTVDCYINQADILPLIHTDEYFEDGYMSEE